MTAEVDTLTRAHTFGAFRGCECSGGHCGINYGAVMEAHGPGAVKAALAGASQAGVLCPVWPHASPSPYSSQCDGHFATLDVIDEAGDILTDYCIPDRAAWDWWRRAVELRATSSDCRVCEPAAWAAVYAR